MKSLVLLVFLALGFQASAQFIVQTSGQIAEHTPYHCLVRVSTVPGQLYENAGAIISPKHVLTAAHIFHMYSIGINTIHVGVGSNTPNRLIYFAIQSWRTHPDYRYGNYHNNYAVLILEHSLSFTSFIQPITLPPLGSDGPLSQEQGQISSFSFNTILKSSPLRINSQIDYNGPNTTFWGEFDNFNDARQCIDITTGDPFIMRFFGVDTIMGFASQNHYCTDTTPIFIARVTKGRQWIHTEFGI